MHWINGWINRIPDRWRLLAQQYGVWVVLVVGVGLVWYFDSRLMFVKYNTAFRAAVGEKKASTWAYQLGYWLAATVLTPTRSVPMLAVVWALAVLHYHYLFARFVVGTGWQKKAVYLVALGGLRWLLVAGLTAWIGFDRMSGAVVNWFLLYVIVYAYFAHFKRLRRVRHQLTAQTTRAELDALKAQINPHFLFNSLNNIFGTALTENGPRTAESVQQLSRILRYMLEQADVDRANVGAELRFLDEYVLLQKQRLPTPTATDVQFDYAWDEEPAQVAPLLLSPLLDYAFRRSVDEHDGTGFLHARAVVEARQLQFVLEYTCADCQSDQADELQNVRQRLALIYPNAHRFALREDGDTAHLELTINLN